MPDFLGRDVTDFILRLLIKDPRRRMGGGRADAEEVHGFFWFLKRHPVERLQFKKNKTPPALSLSFYASHQYYKN